MLILRLAALFFASVAAQPEEHRYNSGAGDTSIFNCDNEYESIEKSLNCESMLKHFDLSKKQNAAFKELLIYGHNGLRNRVALKLNTCDMLAMSWDDNLADLASRHHLNCSRTLMREQTSCPLLPKPSEVARNSFFLNNIYHRHFLVFALAVWYETHTELKFPEKIQHESNGYYRVNGDNSFTHMIMPTAHKLGCSYAMFDNGLSLFCYYYPYLHDNKTVLLRAMPKEYQCPYSFPILDPVFKRLCKYADY